MARPRRHFVLAGVFLALTGLSAGLAQLCPRFWFSWYLGFSRAAMTGIAAATGAFPFCLWQVLLVLLCALAIALLVRGIRNRKALLWVSCVLEFTALLLFLFVFLWGLNHFAPTVGTQLGIEVDRYTKSQLMAATRYYAERAGELAEEVERGDDGEVALPAFSALSDTAAAAYARLAESEPRFSGGAKRVKPLFFSEAYGYMGITGFFFCVTAEPGVSTATYGVAQPFVFCHELAHSRAVAAEDEANYCAFLACDASQDALFRYSGYYNAYIYCSNALYEIDRDAAWEISGRLAPLLARDCGVHVSYNQQYEGAVQEAAQAVNDGYLKAFQQEGTRSYGLVADYLIAHYLALAGE